MLLDSSSTWVGSASRRPGLILISLIGIRNDLIPPKLI